MGVSSGAPRRFVFARSARHTGRPVAATTKADGAARRRPRTRPAGDTKPATTSRRDTKTLRTTLDLQSAPNALSRNENSMRNSFFGRSRVGFCHKEHTRATTENESSALTPYYLLLTPCLPLAPSRRGRGEALSCLDERLGRFRVPRQRAFVNGALRRFVFARSARHWAAC